MCLDGVFFIFYKFCIERSERKKKKSSSKAHFVSLYLAYKSMFAISEASANASTSVSVTATHTELEEKQ